MTSLVRHSLTHETRFSFSALWWRARRRLWIEKVKRSKIVCYPEKTNILTWQILCVTHYRMKRVFRFRHYDEVPEGGSESKKWREANLLVTPRKPTYYHDKSRVAPAHARSAFLRFRPMRKYQKDVSDQKSEEKQTCLLSQENAAGTLGSGNWHFFQKKSKKILFIDYKISFQMVLTTRRSVKNYYIIPSCVSSWVLTLEKSPWKKYNCLSVRLSVCLLVRDISGRRSVLIEKNE